MADINAIAEQIQGLTLLEASQLVKVLEDVISSSRKTCELSLIIAVRTSKPARNRTEREEAERTFRKAIEAYRQIAAECPEGS